MRGRRTRDLDNPRDNSDPDDTNISRSSDILSRLPPEPDLDRQANHSILRVIGDDFLTNPDGKPAGEVVTPGASARLSICFVLAATAAPLRETAMTQAGSGGAPAGHATSRIHHVP